MAALINFVCTNSLDGDHALVERWYADHVNLLFRFDRLHEARLFQRSDVRQGMTAPDATAADAPHYFCLYTFDSPEAFEAFEVSPERAAAPKLGRPDWMPTGIRIVQRQQFRRITNRTRDLSDPQAGSVCQVRTLRLATPDSAQLPEIERWLQGGIHRALQTPRVSAAQLHRCTKAPEGHTDYLSVFALDAGAALAPGVTDLTSPLQAVGVDQGLGVPPTGASTLWQAGYRPVGRWVR